MGKLTGWIDAATSPQMLVTVGMGALALYNSVQAFRYDTRDELERIKARVTTLEKRMGEQDGKLVGRRQFMGCAVRTIDAIRRDTKTPAPCELEITE